MIILSEVRPKAVRKVSGWTEIIVKACLQGMGEFVEEETSGLEGRLKEDVGYLLGFFIFVLKAFVLLPSVALSSSETDSAPSLYEQSLDRPGPACTMGRRAILPPAFQVRYSFV